MYRKIPFLSPCLCLILGIALDNYTNPDFPENTGLLFIFCFWFIFSYSKLRAKYYISILRTFLLSILFIITGIIIFPNPKSIRSLNSSDTPTLIGDQVLCVQAISSGTSKFGNTQFRAKTIHNSSSTRLLVSIKSKQEIKIGDKLIVGLQVKPFPPPEYQGAFDFGQYMKSWNIYMQGRGTGQKLNADKNPFHLLRISETLRSSAINKTTSATASKHVGIMIALSLGDKSYLSEDQKLLFQRTGVYHILAVSGLHVGLIFLLWIKFSDFIIRILPEFRIKTGLLKLTGLLVLWSYVIITGCSPSVLRAGILFSLVLMTIGSTKHSNSGNSLCISLYIILILSPWRLFSPGLLLSYFAVTGILILYKPIRNCFNTTGWLSSKLADLSAISISAQIATLGISLPMFGSFPPYFILANLIAVPISSILLPSTLLGILLASHSPALLFIPDILCEILTFTLSKIDTMPSPISSNLSWSYFTSISWYLLLLQYWYWLKKRSFFSTIALVFVLSLTCGLHLHNSKTSAKKTKTELSIKNSELSLSHAGFCIRSDIGSSKEEKLPNEISLAIPKYANYTVNINKDTIVFYLNHNSLIPKGQILIVKTQAPECFPISYKTQQVFIWSGLTPFQKKIWANWAEDNMLNHKLISRKQYISLKELENRNDL
ncbi:MAG: competence protein ComEC [Limisphaerales bacterium]